MKSYAIKIQMLILAVFSTIAVQAQVKVEAALDSALIHIGQQTTLTANIVAPNNQVVNFPQIEESAQIVPGIEVVAVGKIDTLAADNGLKLKREYILTSFDSANYQIPPFEVEVSGKRYQSAKPMNLKVVSVPVDTTHLQKFFSEKDVVDADFEWSPLFWALVLLLPLLVVADVWLLRRAKRNKPIRKKVVVQPKQQPHSKAIDEINAIKQTEFVTKEEEKTYYVKLTDTLRRYIKERFGVDTEEKTSSEIIQAMEQVNDETALAELREILSTADLVKFADLSTSLSEKDRNFMQALDYVNNTKAEAPEPEKPVVKEIVLEEDAMRRRRTLRWTLITLLSIMAIVLCIYLCIEIYEML